MSSMPEVPVLGIARYAGDSEHAVPDTITIDCLGPVPIDHLLAQLGRDIKDMPRCLAEDLQDVAPKRQVYGNLQIAGSAFGSQLFDDGWPVVSNPDPVRRPESLHTERVRLELDAGGF
jgi:hypothetical protein